MNTARCFIALIFLATGAGSVAWPETEMIVWLIDNDEALDAARAADRPVFIIFTGSDWNVWCERMEDEILSTPQFADFAGENLILLKVDFPKSIELPEARVKKNRKLQRKYGISGYPTVVVTDSDGIVLGRLVYMNGGPEPFLGALTKLIE
ncbi:MAG: thioredoxin [Verrucomicrobia bacterium]|nr:MAG: thioredoxin [Verrucomicrobiota bacterium]